MARPSGRWRVAARRARRCRVRRRHARPGVRSALGPTRRPQSWAVSALDARRSPGEDGRRIITMTTFDEISGQLERQAIEVPSWAFGNSGTRFKVFAQHGVPRDPYE